jgi:SAM-dependent methyltransferase
VEREQFFARNSGLYATETLGPLDSTRALHRYLRSQAVLRLVERYARSGGTIADIGCGPGQLAQPLLRRGFRYIGIDPVPEMFYGTATTLRGEPNATFEVGGAEDLDLESGSVDAALLIGVIEYLHDDDAWILEARRVVAPGGVVVVSFPSLLNPVQAVRTITRPIAAPLIRALAPGSSASRTLYASRDVHRTFLPRNRTARFRGHGFHVLDAVHHGFCMHLRSRPLADGEVPSHLRRESLGARWFPWLGADFICVLRRH